MVEEQRHSDRHGLFAALADRVQDILGQALEARGGATMVVPGGTTPIALYRILRQRPLRWDRVMFCPSDERCVAVDAPESNEGMLRRELLHDAARPARLISLRDGATSPEGAASDCASRLAQIDRPFDLVLLGMGADGHIASLFPGTPSTLHGPPCILANAPDGRLRISLSAGTLLDSRQIILLFLGQEKWRTWEQATASGDSLRYPVTELLGSAAAPPVSVYWAP